MLKSNFRTLSLKRKLQSDLKKQETEEIRKFRFDKANEFTKSENIHNEDIIRLKRYPCLKLNKLGKIKNCNQQEKSNIC